MSDELSQYCEVSGHEWRSTVRSVSKGVEELKVKCVHCLAETTKFYVEAGTKIPDWMLK